MKLQKVPTMILPLRKLQRKILIIGEGGVGKTSLLNRYVNKEFMPSTKMTIGSDFFITKRIVTKDGQENHISLMIWDFAGQERFRFLLKQLALGAKGVILAFDLVRIESLKKLPKWIKLMEEAGLWGNHSVEFFLVGTKKDLIEKLPSYVISNEEIKKFQTEYNIEKFKRTSAAKDEGIDEFFNHIYLTMIEQEDQK